MSAFVLITGKAIDEPVILPEKDRVYFDVEEDDAGHRWRAFAKLDSRLADYFARIREGDRVSITGTPAVKLVQNEEGAAEILLGIKAEAVLILGELPFDSDEFT